MTDQNLFPVHQGRAVLGGELLILGEELAVGFDRIAGQADDHQLGMKSNGLFGIMFRRRIAG
jgi:hypothetical protein